MFKKVIALLLALAMVACMLVGCASKDTAADTTDKTETPAADTATTDTAEAPADTADTSDTQEVIKLKFGYAPPNVTEVFMSCEEYLKKAVASANESGLFDIELICAEPTGNETNYESQVTNLENLLAQGCDAIFCSPGSEDACHNVFEEINQANVPLVLFNIIEAPEGIDAYIVGFDNEQAGAVSGYAFLDYYGGPGVMGTGEMVDVEPGTKLNLEWWENLYKDFDYSQIEDVSVGIISGIEGSIYTIERNDGFTNVVTQSPNVKIAATLNGDWDRATSLAAAENILQANDIDAFFAMCGESEMAATVAVENAGKTDEVMVFGNDGTKETIPTIVAGKITAETWHGFPEWGWYGVETAVRLCLGLECESFIDIGPRTLYAGNAESFLNPEFDAIDWAGMVAEAKG